MFMSETEKDIVWMGDSLNVLQSFPKTVRADLGSDLRRLQIGERPLDSKPIKTVGPGVRELRARDRNNQFRTMYVAKKGAEIVVLHCFIKKSRTTAKIDINTAKERLKAFDRE
jgi:phage-related protein